MRGALITLVMLVTSPCYATNWQADCYPTNGPKETISYNSNKPNIVSIALLGHQKTDDIYMQTREIGIDSLIARVKLGALGITMELNLEAPTNGHKSFFRYVDDTGRVSLFEDCTVRRVWE